jgi:hypothetical protein
MNKQIAFGYPRRGLEGQFATFRLGANWAARVTPGEVVDLVDSRSKKLLKRATVVSVCTGLITDMALQHSHAAHNWKNHPEAERPALLIASMTKRYPPGRVKETSMVSVLYLKEEPDEPDNNRPEQGSS